LREGTCKDYQEKYTARQTIKHNSKTSRTFCLKTEQCQKPPTKAEMGTTFKPQRHIWGHPFRKGRQKALD
jgi:hypothetical protein